MLLFTLWGLQESNPQEAPRNPMKGNAQSFNYFFACFNALRGLRQGREFVQFMIQLSLAHLRTPLVAYRGSKNLTPNSPHIKHIVCVRYFYPFRLSAPFELRSLPLSFRDIRGYRTTAPVQFYALSQFLERFKGSNPLRCGTVKRSAPRNYLTT